MTARDLPPGETPAYLGLCPVHAQEFWFPLDDTVELDCPVAGCEHLLVVYRRLPAPTPSPAAMAIARRRF